MRPGHLDGVKPGHESVMRLGNLDGVKPGHENVMQPGHLDGVKPSLRGGLPGLREMFKPAYNSNLFSSTFKPAHNSKLFFSMDNFQAAIRLS